jgi:hypothetical protein
MRKAKSQTKKSLEPVEEVVSQKDLKRLIKKYEEHNEQSF